MSDGGYAIASAISVLTLVLALHWLGEDLEGQEITCGEQCQKTFATGLGVFGPIALTIMAARINLWLAVFTNGLFFSLFWFFGFTPPYIALPMVAVSILTLSTKILVSTRLDPEHVPLQPSNVGGNKQT